MKNNHGLQIRRFSAETNERFCARVFISKLPNALKKSCDQLTKFSVFHTAFTKGLEILFLIEELI